jgi:hypothetical protein
VIQSVRCAQRSVSSAPSRRVSRRDAMNKEKRGAERTAWRLKR